jgi:signal transduction histidine kinase
VRRRILLTLLASTSIVLFAFLLPLMVLIGEFAADRVQRLAVLEVQPLVSGIPLADPADLPALASTFTAETGRPVTIYLTDDDVVGTVRPLDDSVTLARAEGAYFTAAPGGRDLLVPVQTDDGQAVLRVFVSEDELTAAVPRARMILAALGALLLALSIGLGLWLSRSFLRPIEALGDTAEGLAGGDLTARVPPSDIDEIDTAGRALNRLAGRVKELLTLEREEVADLAHRLRTPVAALRLDVETLPLDDSSDRLRDDVDHLERMVDEVIREARRPVREDFPSSADLCAVARERAEFWSVLAEDQLRELEIDVPPGPYYVGCEARDLGDALDALIGNVFAHTAEGVAFRVAVGVSPGPMAWLEVSDEGPGLPPEALERGRSEAGSTGLGLDIARRLAERVGGSIGLGSRAEGGASVRLTLPPALPGTRG